MYNSPSFWLAYYKHQAVQSGHGLDGFHGLPYQRGGGLGNFFKSLFRIAIPVLKQAAQATARRVGKQALSAVGNIAADISGGRKLKESVIARGKEGLANVLQDSAVSLQTGSGLGVRPLATRIRLPLKRKLGDKKGIVKKRRASKKSDIFGLRK